MVRVPTNVRRSIVGILTMLPQSPAPNHIVHLPHDDRGCAADGRGRTTSETGTGSSSDCGMVRPRALAVFRLMTNANLVGCSTGKSAAVGLDRTPLRMAHRYLPRTGPTRRVC